MKTKNWTGLTALMPPSGRDRADCSSWGDSDPSVCATGSWRSIIASAQFFAEVCWGGGIKAGAASRLNKLVSLPACWACWGQLCGWAGTGHLGSVADVRMKDEIKAILDNPSHPLHDELWQMGSSLSHRIIPPRCNTERFRRSSAPAIIRL